jgi:hypothetical protein
MLDYQITKDKMRNHWQQLVRHGIYDDVFHDTYADYLELRESIPDSVKHLAWFRMRMWNNTNTYDPFKATWLKNKDKNRGRDEYKGASFIALGDYEADGEGPEYYSILDREIKERYADKWEIDADTQCPICQLLLEGNSVRQATELLGYDWNKNKGKRVYDALKDERGEGNGQNKA